MKETIYATMYEYSYHWFKPAVLKRLPLKCIINQSRTTDD